MLLIGWSGALHGALLYMLLTLHYVFFLFNEGNGNSHLMFALLDGKNSVRT